MLSGLESVLKRTLRHLQVRLGLRDPWPLPHFLVIGTQKGGTTSLHHLLTRHSGIFLPAVKEVHYFSQHFHQNLQWYAQHYQDAKPGQLRGDITPFYLFHLAVPARIRSVLPRVKMIALLRDPVERTLSQYFHARRNGYEQLELEEALKAEEARTIGADAVVMAPDGIHYSYQKHTYLSRSRYDEQLQRYLELFPRRQILVLRSEDLFSFTEQCWDDLLSFIDAAPLPLPAPLPHSNSGQGEAAAVALPLKRKLRALLEPTYKWLEREYGLSWSEP